MASVNTAPVSQLGRERVPVFGSFAPNGSSAVDATSRKGLGWTVAWSATGVFNITFTDYWEDVEAANLTLQLNAAAAQSIHLVSYTPSTRVAVIRVVNTNTGAAADIAANANNRIHFCFWFLNTKTGPRRG